MDTAWGTMDSMVRATNDEELRHAYLRVRLSQGEKARYAKLARADGRQLSNWVRRALAFYARRQKRRAGAVPEVRP